MEGRAVPRAVALGRTTGFAKEREEVVECRRKSGKGVAVSGWEARMAAPEKAPAGVEESRRCLKGTAKHLVDKLYGPAGPPWGTPLAALEATALALGSLIQKEFLDLALARQAAAFADDQPC